MSALARGVAELKSCIVDPERDPSIQIFDELAELAPAEARPEEEAEPAEQPEPASFKPVPAVAPQPEVGAAASAVEKRTTRVPPPQEAMRVQLATSSENELDMILSTLEGPTADESSLQDELGTLREPLGGKKAASATGARVLMKGELHPGLLGDLVQLFTQNKETGQLVIEADEQRADIYFAEGHVCEATCRGEHGEKAFFHAMCLQKGRFSYQRGVAAPVQRIKRKTQHLIMDTLRLIDEAQE